MALRLGRMHAAVQEARSKHTHTYRAPKAPQALDVEGAEWLERLCSMEGMGAFLMQERNGA